MTMPPDDQPPQHPYDVEYQSQHYNHETRLNVMAFISAICAGGILLAYIAAIVGYFMRRWGEPSFKYENYIAIGLAVPAVVFGFIALKFHNNAKRSEYIGSPAAVFGVCVGLLTLVYCYVRLWLGFGL